eukprot:GHVL01035139.1.p1 GENE.GHVL01035139.1~~GHVL01035139.1.p1  ORF type:complete len:551 (+),score=199.05 GHVL01035139.1:56-1654(+)
MNIYINSKNNIISYLKQGIINCYPMISVTEFKKIMKRLSNIIDINNISLKDSIRHSAVIEMESDIKRYKKEIFNLKNQLQKLQNTQIDKSQGEWSHGGRSNSQWPPGHPQGGGEVPQGGGGVPQGGDGDISNMIYDSAEIEADRIRESAMEDAANILKEASIRSNHLCEMASVELNSIRDDYRTNLINLKKGQTNKIDESVLQELNKIIMTQEETINLLKNELIELKNKTVSKNLQKSCIQEKDMALDSSQKKNANKTVEEILSEEINQKDTKLRALTSENSLLEENLRKMKNEMKPKTATQTSDNTKTVNESALADEVSSLKHSLKSQREILNKRCLHEMERRAETEKQLKIISEELEISVSKRFHEKTKPLSSDSSSKLNLMLNVLESENNDLRQEIINLKKNKDVDQMSHSIRKNETVQKRKDQDTQYSPKSLVNVRISVTPKSRPLPPPLPSPPPPLPHTQSPTPPLLVRPNPPPLSPIPPPSIHQNTPQPRVYSEYNLLNINPYIVPSNNIINWLTHKNELQKTKKK